MHVCGNVYRQLCPMWGVKTLNRLCWSKRKDLSSFYWILLCYPSCSSKGNTVGSNKPRSKQNLIYYKVGDELLGKLASLKFISYILPQSIIDQFIVRYCGRFICSTRIDIFQQLQSHPLQTWSQLTCFGWYIGTG